MINNLLFPDEIKHFIEIKEKLEKALEKTDNEVRRIDRDYRESKTYMAKYRGEIDPHEMSQNELLLKQTDRAGAFAVELRDKIVRLKESPYFARIDFCEKGGGELSTFYIGKFSFSYEKKLLIFDWRSPVAGMFYDYGLGPAGYDAPIGRIEGVLTRKRQFKIRDGVMEYVLESSSHIQDEVLQRELSHTSDEKMKSILSTIQKEQNQVIRNEKSDVLIIQGVAGSGKTSVALHRIAYLLYRFKNQLNARNVAILSPNKVFGDYISNVIPELGEEPVFGLSLADIAHIQLEGVISFEPDRDPLEAEDEKWIRRVRFKSTMNLVCLMNEYIKKLPDSVFIPSDYTFGRFTAKEGWIRERFHAYGKYPIKQRLIMIADDIHDRFQTENIMQEEIPRPKAILKALTSMLTSKSTLSLYKDFYKKTGVPELFFMPPGNTLEWADVYPFLYLHAAFAGIRASGITKHLVIDEMQDYTPIQYCVINRLFPCPKTILGDFGQSLNPFLLHTLEDIRRLYEDAGYVELNKSYRSTYEIMTFAKQLQNSVPLEAVKRHGEAPSIISCKNEQEEMRYLKNAIRGFEAGNHKSLGIILKTNKAASDLYDSLRELGEINLISPESTSFQNGVAVTSIQMSKGLEFDSIIIPQADSRTYTSSHDRSLLYIACTRAMHQLTLLYIGKPSSLYDTTDCSVFHAPAIL